ncbi:MAG: A/G-specific adenine glycosylase [Chlamydiales bacterium]|nr:A/G-specific adenine glycosylase [Chlamydiales bacterium]
MKDFPVDELKEWFGEHARVLPFRQGRTPYRVWISEVMLQQTQALVVIPYFERWMEAFPTVEALAVAPIEKVLKIWEGLGYYSRARNLHKGAKQIVAMGGFPEDPTEIVGIGPYTAGAIRSFAFHKKAAAVDGNVLRVLARFTGEEGEIDRPAVQKKLRLLAESILPDEESWVVSEALIELGALVCQKKAACSRCPLKRGCVALREGLDLPRRRPREKAVLLERTVGVIVHDDKILLRRGEEGKVMADLFEFPYIEGKRCWSAFADLGLELEYLAKLPLQKHTFTKYRVTLYPHLLRAKTSNIEGWKKRGELGKLPFSSGHKRIYENLTHGEFARLGWSRDAHLA